jgi:hypothetical protein
VNKQNARYECNWYFCWLIEERSEPQPRWLTATADLTVHAHEAIWFARKEDAERVAAEDLRGALIVCEHGFMLNRPSLTTANCEDCPPVGYPTDRTRCTECPRRAKPIKPRRSTVDHDPRGYELGEEGSID